MSVLKEVLEKEYNEVKFVGQDDGNNDTREKMDEIELLIEDNNTRQRVALEQIKYISKRQESIRQCFYGLVALLAGADMRTKPLHAMLDLCFKVSWKIFDNA